MTSEGAGKIKGEWKYVVSLTWLNHENCYQNVNNMLEEVNGLLALPWGVTIFVV